MAQRLVSDSSYFKKVFSLDLRSLALFRMGIGIIILLDLFVRSTALRAHYTDEGLLPRTVLMNQYSSDWFWSFHSFFGSVTGEAVLFGITGAVAFALIAGWKTRWMTLFSWLFTLSIQNRNFMLLNSGDVYLRVILFWALFLPLGARFSLDSALQKDPHNEAIPESICTWASAAFMLQILIVYIFAGWFKFLEPSWQNSFGIFYALNDEQFSRPLGKLLAHQVPLLRAVDPFVLYLETFAGFVCFLPFCTAYFRLFAVILFASFHIANHLLLEVGFFSVIGCVAWAALIPSMVWQKFARPVQESNIKIYYDGDCSVCLKTVRLLQMLFGLQRTPAVSAQTDPKIFAEMTRRNSWIVTDPQGQMHFGFEALSLALEHSRRGILPAKIMRWSWVTRLGEKFYAAFANHRESVAVFYPDWTERKLIYGNSLLEDSVVALLLFYVISWNFSSIPVTAWSIPYPANVPGHFLRLNQGWQMFAKPIVDDGWFVIPATLKDGRTVDLFNEGRPFTTQKPELISATFPTDRWRKYMVGLYQEGNDETKLAYGRYLCRNWNEKHEAGESVSTFRIIFMREDIQTNGDKAPPKEVLLWTHHC